MSVTDETKPWFVATSGKPVSLEHSFHGVSAFLLCSGPSLTTHDLSKLDARGVVTCAVNNAAAIYRPHMWVSVDGPHRFCDGIWRDPGIWKFTPSKHFSKTLRVRNAEGELVSSPARVADMPAVLGLEIVDGFDPATWLTEKGFCWGNDKETADSQGNQGARSVMLVALKLLYVLGVRTVYLLGCDFHMSFGRQNYAFQQERLRSAVRGNNHTYRVLNSRFSALKPIFEDAGFQVWNCTPHSGLVAFPFLSFDDAIRDSTAKIPNQLHTEGMYDPVDELCSEQSQHKNKSE